MLPIHEQLSKLDLNFTQMNFDATSLFPFALCDNDRVYPKIGYGYTIIPHLNNVFVSDFNSQFLIKMVMTQQF